MTSLIERLEAATGPDRELDGLIFKATNPNVIQTYRGLPDYATELVHEEGKQAHTARTIDIPFYTSSIDAAMTLVPEEWSFSVGQNVHHKYWHALVQRVAADGEIESFAETSNHGASLALCIAALKARSQP